MMDALQSINWAILAPVIVIEFILLVIALVDLSRVKETNGPKIMWVFIILFIEILGPILYFVIGRRQS